MKKGSVLLIGFMFVFSMFSVLAINGSTGSDSSGADVSVNLDNVDTTPEEAELGFQCLIDEVGDDCGDTTSIQELALTIMASPDGITTQCVSKLENMERDGHCWGKDSCNVLETSLAIIALDHANKETSDAVDWLMTQNKTSTDLVWYLQQDSDKGTECKFSYKHEGDAKEYNVNVDETKRLSTNAGTCLTLARSSFWYRITNDCYDSTFTVECGEDFLANLLYSARGELNTFFVQSETQNAASYDSIDLKVNSQCFGDGNGCDYESTAWAAIALVSTQNDVSAFLPYIIALADSNKEYLPAAFAYALTERTDYANSLLGDKSELRDYWLARNSAYGKYYDTALALLSLESFSTDETNDAKDWLFFNQDEEGCWDAGKKGRIVDTAMVLWALEGKEYSSSGNGITRCEDADYFCVPRLECTGADVLPGNNFFCSGQDSVCCRNANLKSCSEYNGTVCSNGFVCEGNVRSSLDGSCCLTTCTEDTTTACDDAGYVCKSSCDDNQKENSLDCGSAGVCCQLDNQGEKKGNGWVWFWIILLLIISILGFFGWKYREKVKVWWFKVKSGFKKDKGSKGGNKPRGPGMPPRPGFPPVRTGGPGMPPRSVVQQPRRNTETDPIFKKLKDMSR